MLLLRLPFPKPLATLLKIQLAGWLLLLSVGGCGRPAISESGSHFSPPVSTIAIQDIQSAGKDAIVTLKGTVGNHAPLLGGTVYELQDTTGKIWILTKGQPPEPGKEIVVKGTLRYKSIPIAGKDQGSIYLEQE